MNATSAGGKVKNRNNSSRPISGNLRSAFRSSSVNTGTTSQHLPPEPADPQRRSLLRHIRPIFPEYYGDPDWQLRAERDGSGILRRLSGVIPENSSGGRGSRQTDS